VSASGIARWNGTTWQPLGTGIGGGVYALTVYNGELIAGGNFTTAGGNVSAYWARWGPACPRGDMNCDQIIDLTDVPLFADALLAAPGLATCEAYTANVNGDVDADGNPIVDGRDIPGFVAGLIGGG
jgi:hypothetical protein